MADDLLGVYSKVKKNDPNRNKNDLYRTPPLATYVLWKYTNVPTHVIEPCAGIGNISIELINRGCIVKSYDLFKYDNPLVHIITGQDYMKLEKQEGYTGLITNPPYYKDLPRLMLEKALQEYDYVAFFIRLTFFEGIKRKDLFTNNEISDIIFLSDRINFRGNSIDLVDINDQLGGMIAYCWIVFDKNKKHENTRLHWVKLKDEYEEWIVLNENHKRH